MFRKSHYITFGVVAIVALVLLNLPGRASNRLKLAIGGLFVPLFGLKAAAQQSLGGGGNTNDANRVLAFQNQELLRENERLRKLVGWQQQTVWKMKLGKVVLQEPANWWRSVQIDLGSRDGIRENLTVVTQDGLVGRIGAVGYATSRVILVSDPNFRVSAAVVESKEQGIVGFREPGIIGPIGPLEHSIVEMNCFERTTNVKPGQMVVTSDLGGSGLFKKGIKIGVITDAGPVEYGLYTQARVKLFVNLTALEEVWVILP